MTEQHPLTDELIDSIAQFNSDLGAEGVFNRDHDMRAAYDKGDADRLDQVLKWLEFDYQTDPNVSREMRQRGGFNKIAIALEKAMRPQQQENN